MPDVQLVKIDYDTAEATFRYDVAKVIAGYNPKKPPTDEAIAKRLDELLRTASNGTFTLKPGAAIPSEKLEAVRSRSASSIAGAAAAVRISPLQKSMASSART